MPYDLLVIGDCSIDLYMQIENPSSYEDAHAHDPQICFFHGSKIPVDKFKANLAGNACHVGIGAQKLGLKTAVYTELGDDDNATKFTTEFTKYGVDTAFCKRNKETATNIHAVIWYSGERTIFSYHEPRKYALPFSSMQKPQWVFYTSLAKGFESFQEELVEYLDKHPDIGVAFNPGTIQLNSGKESLTNILKKVHILFMNKQEALKLLGSSIDKDAPLRDLHKALHRLGPKISVITDGENGSSAFDQTEFLEQQAIPIEGKIHDKTGAGDAYAAAFLSALHYKKSLKEAMRWGNLNSASILKGIGAINGLLTKEELHAKL